MIIDIQPGQRRNVNPVDLLRRHARDQGGIQPMNPLDDDDLVGTQVGDAPGDALADEEVEARQGDFIAADQLDQVFVEHRCD